MKSKNKVNFKHIYTVFDLFAMLFCFLLGTKAILYLYIFFLFECLESF
jgi:hypothetical protein